MAKSEYRGQDTIVEKIQALVTANKGVTWDEACDAVADAFAEEELFSSATYALGQKVGV